MAQIKRVIFLLVTSLAAFSLWQLPFDEGRVLAHGGEDHGGGKTTIVTTDKGTFTHTAKAGDFEILLKHAPFEPDLGNTARLFVTDHATNEPLGDEALVEIVGSDGGAYQSETIKAGQPGSFDVKLPPLPEGSYTVSARIIARGKSNTATFSQVAVAHQETAVATNIANNFRWQTVLLALAGSIVLSAISCFGYFAWRYARGKTEVQTIQKEAVSV